MKNARKDDVNENRDRKRDRDGWRAERQNARKAKNARRRAERG